MSNTFSKVQEQIQAKQAPIGIVGLGYVGLPLATLFATKYKVIGFDIHQPRVDELRKGLDHTHEVTDSAALLNPNIRYTTDAKELGECPILIVAVPTPVDNFNVPDLLPVKSASRTVGKNLAKGTIVVFESTVYPGVTESICADMITEESGLSLNEGYFLGYSPERVVPGDKDRTIEKITKIVSGSTLDVGDLLAWLYGSVVKAGVHRAPSIKVAEAAKVIENTQRDLNIALVNELSMLFDKVGIDTLDVLAAAGTKWNFLPFRPGLVGGHCISVDPYYLTHLAESIGFQAQVISAGRRINNHMGPFVAQKTVSMILNAKEMPKNGVNVAVMGVTFKENVPDVRNSKVFDLAKSLEHLGVRVHLTDPYADPAEVEHEYGYKLVNWDEVLTCDAIIMAVPHKCYLEEWPLARLVSKLTNNRILIDLKGVYPRSEASDLGVNIWRL